MPRTSLLFSIAVAALAGCSTTSLPIEKLPTVPAERVTWEPSQAPQTGTLTIARDAGFSASAARVVIAVDGIPAVDVRDSEAVSLT